MAILTPCSDQSSEQHYSVVVVGAGMAGLLCAETLAARDIDVLLLEARDRVGGRLHSVDGVDLGGSWLWPEQNPLVQRLIERLGANTVRQRVCDDAFVHRYGAAPENAGNTGSRIIPCGAGALRLKGGYATVVQALAAKLDPGSLMLGCSVRQVAQIESGLRVDFEQGGVSRSVVAGRLVLAAPPGVLISSISFDPPLPEAKAIKMRRTATWCGDWCKVAAEFSRPFWKELGASGVVATELCPISSWWEAAGDDEQVWALVGLGVGPQMARFVEMTQEQLREVVLTALTPVFGSVVADCLVRVWHHSWQGDRESFNAEGVEREYGHPELQRQLNHGIHFAGTETEPNNGHIEGAIASAKRVVEEILESL